MLSQYYIEHWMTMSYIMPCIAECTFGQDLSFVLFIGLYKAFASDHCF